MRTRFSLTQLTRHFVAELIIQDMFILSVLCENDKVLNT